MSDAAVAGIVYDLRASGVVRNLLRIAGAAREAGIDFEIWPLRPQGEFLDEARGVAPIRPVFPEPTDRQRDLDSLLGTRALRAAIVARKPALVFSAGNQMHLHVARALGGIDKARRPRLLGRASNRVVSAGAPAFTWRAALAPVEAYQYRAMDRIVAVSHELAGQIEQRFTIGTGTLSTIPNGIDVERFAGPAPTYAPNDVPLVLGVGRISKQKDFATLIRAFALVRRDPEPELRILGRASEEAAGALRDLARDLGVGDRVELAGHVSDVADHFRAADLFVSSSRWEGASNVVLEALACGTPVVATAAPTGIREVLEPLDPAAIVPVGDAAALARAIERKLSMPRDPEANRARARDFALADTLAAYVRVIREELVRAG